MTRPPCLRLCPPIRATLDTCIEGESPLQAMGHTVSVVAIFGCTGALLSLFPGPGSNGCSWGSHSRDAGLVLPRCDRNPLRGRHTLLGLSGSPLEKAPLV